MLTMFIMVKTLTNSVAVARLDHHRKEPANVVYRSKSVLVLCKGANLEKAMQADDGNDASPPSSPIAESGSQRCVASPELISRD